MFNYDSLSPTRDHVAFGARFAASAGCGPFRPAADRERAPCCRMSRVLSRDTPIAPLTTLPFWRQLGPIPSRCWRTILILDEVQRCPELLVAIKKNVDEQRRPGRFILSGSANLALLGHVSETLAGRAVYLTLHPMTRREKQGNIKQPPFLMGVHELSVICLRESRTHF